MKGKPKMKKAAKKGGKMMGEKAMKGGGKAAMMKRLGDKEL